MDEQRKNFFYYGSFYFSMLACILGATVMLGWFFHKTILIQVLPNLVPMQFNTALLLFLVGLSAFLTFYRLNVSGLVISIFVLLLSSASLFQYILNLNLGIDEFFIKHYITTKSTYAGRMAPNTAICYMLSSIGILLLNTHSFISKKWVSSFLAIITIGFALSSLLGYAISVEEAHSWKKLTGMALHTSFGFLLIGCSILFFSVTYDSEGKVSSWIISPLKIGCLFFTMLTWRAFELNRIDQLVTTNKFDPNYFFIGTILIFTLLSLFLMKITVDISRKMELAQFDAKISSERKTNLLRFVSHEIRNPITTITGFCEILVNDPSITGEKKESLNCIYCGAEHIKNIVNDLLAVSKFDSGKITIESKEFELSSWIESFEKILNIRAQLKDINFKIIRKEPFPSKATGDSLKLSQIIINLTENAFKFTPEKGEVTLDLSFSHNLLTIVVKDNGRGIPLNAQKNLFTPFFQVQPSKDYSGLGLGLSICREFVDMMEGTIDFISEEGKGSTFTWQIPLASVK